MLRQAANLAGLELSQNSLCLRRPPLKGLDIINVRTASRDNLIALRIAAAEGVLPSVESLPPRVDYLNALAETLGVPTVCPFSLHGGRGGQRSKQPLIYVGVHTGDGPDPRPPNAIASAVTGVDVRGDALLTSADFREGDRLGELGCKEPTDMRALMAAVVDRSGEPAGFVASRHGRPLLGSWVVPRTAAFMAGAVGGVAHPPPKAVLNEFLTAHPQEDVTQHNKKQKLTTREYPPDRPEGQPPRGFTGHVTLRWPADVAPPPDATITTNGVENGGTNGDAMGSTIELATRPQPCKSTKGNSGFAAEDMASQLMLDALQIRTAHRAGQEGAPAALALTPPLRILELRKPAPVSVERSLLPAGTKLELSYTLRPLAAGTEPPAVVPPVQAAAENGAAADAAAPPAALLPAAWEQCSRSTVLLGQSVLQPDVEDLLSEMGAGESGTAYARVQLLQSIDAWVRLVVEVHRTTLPAEERPRMLMFGAMGQISGISHGEERMQYVTNAVSGWTDCESLADVGCGEAKLLMRLVGRGLGVRPRLLGLDSTLRGAVLRRAGDKLTRALADFPTAPAATPEVALLRGGLAECDVAVDGMVLVEVVEHLDPPDLNAIGPALLGKLRPKRLLVTTPNKEYNLNFMEIPKDTKPDAAGRYILPPLSSYGVRNEDHRFEWSRAEFKAWANGVAAAHGYTVAFDGIGGGPMDEVVPYGEWRGAGPQTQVAIFQRTPADEGEQPVDGPPVDFTATQMEVVWHSASEDAPALAAMNAAASEGVGPSAAATVQVE